MNRAPGFLSIALVAELLIGPAGWSAPARAAPAESSRAAQAGKSGPSAAASKARRGRARPNRRSVGSARNKAARRAEERARKTVGAGIDAGREQRLDPAEQRRYSISIEGGTYADLLDGFARMSGLSILGEIPQGAVSYVSPEEMDYETALNRLRRILFEHPGHFCVRRQDHALELFRVTEAQRKMSLDRVYTSMEEFIDADLDDMELVMVLYTPEESSIAQLEPLRAYLPEYVRMSPYRDTNAVVILALAGDISKFLGLVELFAEVPGDPRQLVGLDVNHLQPSAAVAQLTQLMPALRQSSKPPAGRSPRARRGRKVSSRRVGRPRTGAARSRSAVTGQGIDLIPFDELDRLFVRAMPEQIEEVESYLAMIDLERGPHGSPTPIALQHVRVEDLMARLRPLYGQQPSRSARPRQQGKRRRPPARTASRAIVTDDIRIYPHPDNNTLIVFGDHEAVGALRGYVDLFDVPADVETVRVPLEHADPGAVKALAERMAPAMDGISAASLLVEVDPVQPGLLVIGHEQARQLAETIIAGLDLPSPDGPPSIYSYHCRRARPSTLVRLLIKLDPETTFTPRPAARQQQRPAKKGGRRARPRIPSVRYHGDDSTGTVYVVCSRTEWEEHYLPLVETLDRQADSSKDLTLVTVDHVDPASVIGTVTRAVGQTGKRPSLPKLLAHPRGVVLLGGTEGDVQTVRRLIGELDVPPDRERRTFTLEHAERSKVMAVLEGLFADRRTAPRASGRSTAKRGARRRGKRPPVPPPPAGAVDELTLVDRGRNDLIVEAGPEVMSEVAAVISELDVDDLAVTVRTYGFPPGSDVGEIAHTMSLLCSGSAPAHPAPRRGRGREPRQTTEVDAVRFIPRAATNELLVSAPAKRLEEIEEQIDLLRTEDEAVRGQIGFIPVGNRPAAEMAQTLEPLLEAQCQHLLDTGALALKPEQKVAQLVSVTPDPRGDRLIVITPPQLSDAAVALAEQLDRPDRPHVVKTVPLRNADPRDMVSAVRPLLQRWSTAPSSAPRGKRPGPGRRSRTQRHPAPTRVQSTVTIAEAPGDAAVVLGGDAEHVEHVERWIGELDRSATAGRSIRIYAPQNIGIEEFADAVMALIDLTGGRTASPPPEDEFFADFGGGPRRGKDIDLVTDVWANTAVVSTTPSKMQQIDRLFEMYEGKLGEEPAVPVVQEQPFDTYTLQHRDDTPGAAEELEMILDALWPDPQNVPLVDYIPFTDTLTVHGGPKDFEQVREIIARYVDKPGKQQPGVGYEVFPVRGMTPAQMARMIEERLGSDTVNVVNEPESAQRYGVKQVKP